MKKYMNMLIVLTLFFFISACQFTSTADQVVTIFSERHYDSDQALYDEFTKLTGIKVNLVRDGADPLMTRLINEGEDSLADVLIIADAGRLHRAKESDLLSPVTSEIINQNVGEQYRDIDNYWFGLTIRARVIVYHPERVNADELSTYDNLTDPKWEGRIVTRTSTNIYSQSFMASMIAIKGEEAAKNFALGLVNNFARDPQGNDRDQAKALLEGVADIAIMNTYYIGRMMFSADPFEVEVAETVRVFFPNQDSTGTHVNVSAAGVTKYAKNRENAIRLIEFLTSPEAQRSYADANFEYPIHQDVEPHALLQSWGTFKTQEINLSLLGVHSYKAITLMNEVGWK
jgi:iron(III) transport system substrate-binding protein